MIPPRILYKPRVLKILDQRLIPYKTAYIAARNAGETAKAIRDMVLRGAPLIGCAAAYGMLLEIENSNPSTPEKALILLKRSAATLKSARPTALALFYAVDRMLKKAERVLSSSGRSDFRNSGLRELRSALKAEADSISREDKAACLKMGRLGARLLKKKSSVITHCNAGALATMGIGTAVGVITEAAKLKKINHAYSCETRPYLQGARLTIWELMKNRVASSLLTDNMAGHIMSTEKIDAVIVGADRIAANGDTANKIGTYSLAILAKYHGIPFYIIAPTPTIDMSIKTGASIKIEERSSDEVTTLHGKLLTPKGVKARHPAFDVTPASLITAIVTEKGVISPVNAASIKKNLKK